MTDLVHVYLDESGTAPEQDSEPLFISAAVAVSGNPKWRNVVTPPKNDHLRHAREALVHWFNEITPITSCTLIRPYPGYSKDLTRKMGVWKHILKTRITQRSPDATIPPNRVGARNFAWMSSLIQTLPEPICLVALNLNAPLTGIKLFIDCKSLTREEKTFFESFLREKVAEAIASSLENPYYKDQMAMSDLAAGIRARARVSNLKVDLEWSDDPNFSGDLGLLSLADGASHYLQRELRSTAPESGFLAELERVGRRIVYRDITRLLVRMDYQDWERKHRQKIPKRLLGDGE